MVYDSESNMVILLAGEPNTSTFWHDTWSYDTESNTWAELEPLVDDFGTFAYDLEADRVIGYMNTKGKLAGIGKTLAYDFNTGSRVDLENDGTPIGYLGAQLAYDSESDRIILYGGYRFSENRIIDETWAFDYNSNTWIKMNPNINPPGRNFHSMVYIPTIDRVLMFGGDVPGPTEHATWLYDFNQDTWEKLEIEGAPIIRHYTSMVYIDSLDRVILFGGEANVPESKINDMWAFDPHEKTWTELKPEQVPSARGWHAMTYDSAADKIILFGGGSDRRFFTNETWVYDPQTNIWTDMTPGH